jgi:NAD(P)-dependent dehydrogenase (short-subunit alcohol dehydrogenase family)
MEFQFYLNHNKNTAKMKQILTDKVAIVTGASSGIGLATSREFIRHGVKVVMADINVKSLKEVTEQISREGGQCIGIRTDVSNESDCKHMVDEAIRTYGQIDILVNNAGISMRALFKDLDLSVIKRLMDINFWGAVFCTKHSLPYLLERNGSVVGISSVAGFHGLPGRTGYSASKFAIHGFLETLRIENMKNGLHVMIISPGFTSTNIRKTALAADGSTQGESPRDEGKMMTPEFVARHLVRGIQKKKRFIVLSFEGQFSWWFGKFFPGWLDKITYNHMAKEPDSPFK